MDPIFGYNFHSALQNTEQLLEKNKSRAGRGGRAAFTADLWLSVC